MTKKQLKKLARDLADLEYTIQTSNDSQKVYEAKEKMTHLTEAANIELEDMIALDELIQNNLQSKK